MKTNIILQGDALTKLKELPDESIDCVMTSPPYWALRDYGIEGQLGLEPTFEQYINDLCNIFDEVKRVLKNTGTCWVNLGDTYAGGGGGNYGSGISSKQGNSHETNMKNKPKFLKENKLQSKCLTMIPQRFAIEMTNRGWILRNNIIWYKPNCMPSSVKDRFTVDFEYVFFFTKNKKYYFETQYEPLISNAERGGGKKIASMGAEWGGQGLQNWKIGNSSNGRNKRTVWRISPKPFKEAHFAVYPEELCETPIKAGCPEFVCAKCGKPKVLEIEIKTKEVQRNKRDGDGDRAIGGALQKFKNENPDIIKGYKPACSCNDKFTGGIVLDPFFGAGTTGIVALKQNKKFIGIELNKEYIEIAEKRLKPYLEQTTLSSH